MLANKNKSEKSLLNKDLIESKPNIPSQPTLKQPEKKLPIKPNLEQLELKLKQSEMIPLQPTLK